MSKNGLILVPLVLVVVAGLLIAGGWAIHRIGWTEGYAVGIGRAAGEVSLVPYTPTGLSYLALFLTAGLAFLMLMGLITKLIGLWVFKAFASPWMLAHRAPVGTGGRNGERWPEHGYGRHRHVPPWCWGWEESAGKPPADEERGASGGPNSAST
jgi:hypothetical protein